MTPAATIGLDVGGAGTKAARWRPGVPARATAVPHEAWREPDRLAEVIARALRGVQARAGEPVALTTTAELCDVFPTKAAGVRAVLDAAAAALGGHPWTVWTTAGELVVPETARADPLPVAAANWLATATAAARAHGDGEALLVDVGSTTTDVVPLRDGRSVARGRTDRRRLEAGELVYTGALRTDVAAIVREVPLRDGPCPVSAERFAVAADAHRVLGHLTTGDTAGLRFPDGRGPDEDACRARLARVVCADPPELADGDVVAIARAVHDAQVEAIARAIRAAADRCATSPVLLVVGSGAFLAHAAAERVGLAAREAPGPLAGAPHAPAVALAMLAAERGGGP